MNQDPHSISGMKPELLFRRLTDGQLTPAEFQAVENRLAAEPDFRAAYVRFMDLEACLYDELSIGSHQLFAPDRNNRTGHEVPNRGGFRNWPVLTLVAASLIMAFATIWIRLAVAPGNTQFLEAQLKGLEDAAIVTHSQGIRQNTSDRPLVIGTRLKPGVLQLRQGELQIDFLCGARVLLRAPSELHVLSSTSATLVTGSIAARVTDGTGKFVLGAPDAAIVDLGTEFAVNVDRKGNSEVHVFEGEVEVSLLGDDGNTLFSQRLLQEETVHIDRASRSVRPSSTQVKSFATVKELDRSKLIVTPEYVQLVRRSKPMVYWRFESIEMGRVQNEMGSQYSGEIIGNPPSQDSITISDGVAHFAASDQPRFLQATESLNSVNRKAFTIELWINPETFHWGTLVNLMVPEAKSNTTKKAQLHMGLIELAHQTPMVHKPSVVRYLHRHPPGDHTWGWNLFSPETCTPGGWTHVVTVKEPDELKLFVNGVLVRRIQGSETAGSDEDPYQFTVGQFGTLKASRQYLGMLDELAVYNRALNEVEISEHYWTMITAGKAASEK